MHNFQITGCHPTTGLLFCVLPHIYSKVQIHLDFHHFSIKYQSNNDLKDDDKG